MAPMQRRALLALVSLIAARPALAAEPRPTFAAEPRPTLAAELSVLSAGAVEPGLEAAIASFRAATGQAVRTVYATAPQLRERITAGEAPDILVAPLALLGELGARLGGPVVPLGK